ncbi:MAG: hypothetical protein NVS3B25_07370 [Hymenobacter sp.]
MKKPAAARRWTDFFAGGNNVFDVLTLWMNAFCGLYAYAYWRVVELTTGHPPREMTAGLVAIVLFYITGDKLLATAFVKAQGGAYEQVPATQNNLSADTVEVPVTGDNPVINQTPNTQTD